MNNNSSVAVFIDVENILYSTLNNYSETPDWSFIVDACKAYGRISFIQAFGDWIEFPKEVPEIQRNGIQPVFVPLSQDKKSSLDCYLTVSAMKLFFQNSSIDTLILASGDRDYIPLISELKASGKSVIILAVPETLSKDLTSIVDGVISYESKSVGRVGDASIESADRHEFQEDVIGTVRECEERSPNDRWVNLAAIGLALKKKDSNFTHTKYGYRKLADMLHAIPQLELKYDNYEKTVALTRTRTGEAVKDAGNLLEGTICNIKEGYGFIRPNEGHENIFFHHSKLLQIELWELNTGDEVSFSVYNTDRGLSAENVQKKA